MTEKIGITITAATVVVQSVIWTASGGFTAGGKLALIESEIKLIRQEIGTTNQLQDYRLDKLEAYKKHPEIPKREN
jgi:hypothetical protein